MGSSDIRVKYLLISDLDETLLGDDEGLEAFCSYLGSIALRTTLVYASGRFFETIHEDIRNTALPEPAAVIAGVGSEIRSFPEGERFEEWTNRITKDWSAETVRKLLAGTARLESQPEELQSEWKVSYYYPDAGSDELEAISRKLEANRLKVNCIYSSSRDLDILPGDADKGSAARWLAEKWSFPLAHVMAAGNSDNDRAMMGGDMKGIIVANAHDELKQLASREGCYLASRGHGYGVIEGIRHWRERIETNGA